MSSDCNKYNKIEVDGLYMTIHNETNNVIIRAMKQISACMRCTDYKTKKCNLETITKLLERLERNDE